MFLQDSNLPGLTIRETNLLFSMLFTKAVTDELSKPLLKKGTLDILYDGAKGALTLEQKMTSYVDVKVDKHLEGALTRLLTNQVGFDEVFNGDAYMKLIKEQEGVAMKQRFLQKFGLSVLDVERDAKVDYKIKQSDGKEILLECKSCWQKDLDREITRTFERVRGPFEMFWENTETWEKTLFKIDEKGIKHVVYEERSQKKLNR